MRNFFETKIKDFSQNEDGTFAIMFAIFMTALLLAVGIAIDYSKMIDERAKLQA